LGRWTEAIEDYTQAMKLSDKSAATWCNRGAAWAELREWDKAVADLTQAVERAPTDRVSLAYLAIAHLGRGDAAAYRRACLSLYQRLGHTDQPRNLNKVAWFCCLTSNDAVDPAQLVRLMDRAVAAGGRQTALLGTRGSVLYRAGRYEDAVSQLNEAIEAHGKGGAFEDLVFLAMAQSHLKQADRANQTLRKALALYEEKMKPPKSGPPALDWSTRVQWRQLRKEAEALVHKDRR
jgi:Tfp pilus assembly protein PilF